MRRTMIVLLAVGVAVVTAAPAHADGPATAPNEAVAVGAGGGVATVDADATAAGLAVLEAGGTAADAAVAAAAALGVTEPYSAGIGGGGFFVHYDAETGETSTLDGRETAPFAMGPDAFVDPATGAVLDTDRAISSGLSVGVPGTPATWEGALERWGHLTLGEALAPAAALARDGFVVDAEFRGQTAQNEERFRLFPDTAALFLPGGALPVEGSTFTNPALADTYQRLGAEGAGWLYGGELGAEVAATAAAPPVAAGASVPPGLMTADDVAAYEALEREPLRVDYRGLEIVGMPPPSSGGTTVGEALNILEASPFPADPAADPAAVLHLYLEASRLAYADRNRFLGDPDFVDVPADALVSDEFAAQRACLIDPARAATSPVPAGDPSSDVPCAAAAAVPAGREGPSTTHLVTADRWGDVVSYTLTIEQTGGSGITVPGRGFLLNNELTDFDIAPPAAGEPLPANAPDGGKRPRSSMAPTIVFADGQPLLAVGSPGGATIITTVLQTLVNRLDLGMSLPDAVAAPRLSQRNSPTTEAEQPFLDGPLRAELEAYGQAFALPPSTFSPAPEIGSVAALEFRPDGTVQYVAEPVRRGGGSAAALP